MMSKNRIFKRITFMILFLVIIVVYYIYSIYSINSVNSNNVSENDFKPHPNMKYILLWTSEKTEPFMFIGLGQKGFIERNCSYTNCFVTAAKKYFGDYTKFHAIVFACSELIYYHKQKLPLYRRPEQKYVFSSVESSHNYPVCSSRFDGYFNWTWSYRLDSDCRWEYIAIRDEQFRVIGPNKDMHWMELKDMRPVSADLKKKLQKKTIAAAWFASNCPAKNRREMYVYKLKHELSKFNHTIDIYGQCGNLACPLRNKTCFQKISDNYYFYLSFENSFSEDYVTEKLLHALQNNAIPIVYGGANYTRFMPDGIYLDAKYNTPRRLAKIMNNLILDPDKYAEYFKWQNHYSYHYRHESEETDDICAFCELLNDEVKFNQTSVIKNFQKWWDVPNFCGKEDLGK